MSETTSTTQTESSASKNEHTHRYNTELASEIEIRWQKYWEDNNTFVTPNPGDPNFDASKPKFYCLDMYPYPSGAGLHVGHSEGYIATDIVSRFKRMKGYNVLHPMGWDAFGLPAEQYAIQTGVHPAITTQNAIDTFKRQLKRFGFSYDWSREFATIDQDYYKWTQWIWLKAYNAWYDEEHDGARHIDDLITEFKSGLRTIQYDPNRPTGFALEGDAEQTWDSWDEIDQSTQRLILSTYRLAYLSTQTVNWCPKLGTVLANEEVIDGKSERGSFPVLRMPLKQWMFRITAYADRLLNDLHGLDWPESTRTMQRDWIGRSTGAEVSFEISDLNSDISNLRSQISDLKVFTTRPDTIFGATYMVVAPEHPLVDALLENLQPNTDIEKLRDYVETARNKSDVDRMAETKEKTGVYIGVDAINPATEKPIPIWVADYVLMGYGTGAIMAVPGQDQRDWDFAKTFDLPIVRTVKPNDEFEGEAFTDEGPAMNSGFLDGLGIEDAKKKTIEWLESNNRGREKVNYKLHDWLFSRQRYWGEPFPVVFDDEGNHYPVDETNLPVVLPEMEDYKPIEAETPTPPLGKATDWVNTTAGEAGVSADLLDPNTPVHRETNTMPNWAGSCWYYLRYCDSKCTDRFTSREAESYWMSKKKSGGSDGVDLYIGGAEHAVLHLLYARFWHKILFDFGEVSTPEPISKLFHQGMIVSHAFQRADKTLVPIDEVEERSQSEFVESATGEPVTQIMAKMSKSLKNVINPDDIIHEYGADSFRLYEMYMGPLEAMKPWNTRDIIGIFRFLKRIWKLAVRDDEGLIDFRIEKNPEVERKLHATIKKVEGDIERLSFNTAIAAMIEFVNVTNNRGGIPTQEQMCVFLRLLSPFAPHIAQELWCRIRKDDKDRHGDTNMGELVCKEEWPKYDPTELVENEIEIPVQIMGKVRCKIVVAADADKKAVEEIAMNDERVKKLLEGKNVRKVIVVPGKIVNIVAN